MAVFGPVILAPLTRVLRYRNIIIADVILMQSGDACALAGIAEHRLVGVWPGGICCALLSAHIDGVGIHQFAGALALAAVERRKARVGAH